MSLFSRKGHEEPTLVIEIETEPLPDEENNEETTSHCAWCGDPPDKYGSHGICAAHAAQMIEQAVARRSRR